MHTATIHSILWSERENRWVLLQLTAFLLVVLQPLLLFALKGSPKTHLDAGALAPLLRTAPVHPKEDFLHAKEILEAQVVSVLHHADGEDSLRTAHNLAVYLFPKVLAVDDVERAATEEDWAPLLWVMQNTPHSAESVAAFREFEALLRTYEGAVLSQEAQTILEVYRLLSQPREHA